MKISLKSYDPKYDKEQEIAGFVNSNLTHIPEHRSSDIDKITHLFECQALLLGIIVNALVEKGIIADADKLKDLSDTYFESATFVY